jgi:hypothetical protein
MRIVFLPPSVARLAPAHPAVFHASGLAREVLLTLAAAGPRAAASSSSSSRPRRT